MYMSISSYLDETKFVGKRDETEIKSRNASEGILSKDTINRKIRNVFSALSAVYCIENCLDMIIS